MIKIYLLRGKESIGGLMKCEFYTLLMIGAAITKVKTSATTPFKKILAQFDTYFEREVYHGSLLVLYILNAARQVSYTFSSTRSDILF